MGHQRGKRQVVVYLPPEVHEGLRVQAARTSGTISGLVERALRAELEGEGRRLPLPADTEPPPLVLEALAGYGAPLWSRGDPTSLTLDEAIAEGLTLARSHPSLLRALPVVLFRNRRRVRWRTLRARVPVPEQPALGMLLELTAELTGFEPFRRWADELRRRGVRQDPPAPFFVTGTASGRYRELAEHRTPEVVRRWGFLMATTLDDFQDAMRRHCPDSSSSTART